MHLDKDIKCISEVAETHRAYPVTPIDRMTMRMMAGKWTYSFTWTMNHDRTLGFFHIPKVLFLAEVKEHTGPSLHECWVWSLVTHAHVCVCDLWCVFFFFLQTAAFASIKEIAETSGTVKYIRLASRFRVNFKMLASSADRQSYDHPIIGSNQNLPYDCCNLRNRSFALV